MQTDANFTAVCATTNETLSPAAPCCWSFAVTSVKNYLFAGICLKSSVTEHGFTMWPWNELGFGHYMLGSECEVYSQSDFDINLGKMGYAFVAEDVVWCQYANGELAMVKNQGQTGYIFKVELAPDGEEYAPCVYLVDAQDAV